MTFNYKQLIAEQRWRIQIGYNIIGVFGIGLVIAKTLQEILLGLIYIPIYVMYPFGLLLLWISGFLYIKLGLYSNEQHYNSKTNPYFEKYIRKGDK